MRVVFEGVLYSRAGSVTGFTVVITQQLCGVYVVEASVSNTIVIHRRAPIDRRGVGD